MLQLFFLFLRVRDPPTGYPAFDLPVDRRPDAGSDGDVMAAPPPGYLDPVWWWRTANLKAGAPHRPGALRA